MKEVAMGVDNKVENFVVEKHKLGRYLSMVSGGGDRPRVTREGYGCDEDGL